MKKSTPPPSHLKTGARSMWKKLLTDYLIEDAGGLALLQAACESFQRAQEARRLIDKEGAVIKDRFGQRKAHPAVSIERDNRAQMISALRALKLAPEDMP